MKAERFSPDEELKLNLIEARKLYLARILVNQMTIEEVAKMYSDNMNCTKCRWYEDCEPYKVGKSCETIALEYIMKGELDV